MCSFLQLINKSQYSIIHSVLDLAKYWYVHFFSNSFIFNVYILYSSCGGHLQWCWGPPGTPHHTLETSALYRICPYCWFINEVSAAQKTKSKLSSMNWLSLTVMLLYSKVVFLLQSTEWTGPASRWLYNVWFVCEFTNWIVMSSSVCVSDFEV